MGEDPVRRLNRMRETCTSLQPYAELEGSEVGELCRQLIVMAEHTTFMSDRLVDVLDDEIARHLNYFESHATITRKTETVTRKIKIFEWNE